MESKFTGGLLGLIGINILRVLLVAITLGIATPWALCTYHRGEPKPTIIAGQQLEFDGTGGQVFGKYTTWLLLTIITFGIYSFWLGIKMKQWVTYHTHVAK